MLFEAFSGLTDEEQKLIFRNANYGDALAFSFESENVRGLVVWY
jgi:hypothetical protein